MDGSQIRQARCWVRFLREVKSLDQLSMHPTTRSTCSGAWGPSLLGLIDLTPCKTKKMRRSPALVHTSPRCWLRERRLATSKPMPVGFMRKSTWQRRLGQGLIECSLNSESTASVTRWRKCRLIFLRRLLRKRYLTGSHRKTHSCRLLMKMILSTLCLVCLENLTMKVAKLAQAPFQHAGFYHQKLEQRIVTRNQTRWRLVKTHLTQSSLEKQWLRSIQPHLICSSSKDKSGARNSRMKRVVQITKQMPSRTLHQLFQKGLEANQRKWPLWTEFQTFYCPRLPMLMEKWMELTNSIATTDRLTMLLKNVFEGFLLI